MAAIPSEPDIARQVESSFLQTSHTGAVLFFQLMSRRYEHASHGYKRD